MDDLAPPVHSSSTPETKPASFWSRKVATIRQLGPAGLMGVLSLVLPPIGAAILLSQLDHFAQPLREHAWGPILCAAIFGVLGGFALLPTGVLAIFAGWAWAQHFWTGFSVAVLGFTLAAAIGFHVVSRFSGTKVVTLLERYPKWSAVHHTLLDRSTVRTFLVIFLLRVPSAPPFAMTTVSLASLRVRFWPFLLATFLGVMPRTAAYVFIASKAEKLDYRVADGWQMLAVWGGFGLLVLLVLAYIARRTLHHVTSKVPPVQTPI